MHQRLEGDAVALAHEGRLRGRQGLGGVVREADEQLQLLVGGPEA